MRLPWPVNLNKDGSDGEYQFTTAQGGLYVIDVTLPPGYKWSDTCLPQGTLDPPGQPNPYVLGNHEDPLNPGFLAATDCTSFYLQIDLEQGDPLIIINNNFPLQSAVVGGVTEPIGGLALLTPWLAVGALALLLAGAALIVWRRRIETL